MQQLIVSSCRFAGLGLLILLLMLAVGPGRLLCLAAYLTLAAGLGLHLPTLAAGHLLYVAVSGLACMEPLLVGCLLFWAVHKTVVRGLPLIDRNYWRCRWQRRQ